MVLRRIKKAVEAFEDPDHPLLGPNLKGLNTFGFCRRESTLQDYIYYMVYTTFFIIVLTEYIEFYNLREDVPQALMNFSITGISTVTLCKVVLLLTKGSKWKELIKLVSKEEISAIEKNDTRTLKLMEEYKKYSRKITYFYWAVAFATNIIANLSPAIKYLSMPKYRERIRNGTEPYPQIMITWVPFDKNTIPGYIASIAIHIFFLSMGSAFVAVYDTNAVTLLTFLKGQAKIIKYKSSIIFGEKDLISEEEVLNRVRECHRHHDYLKNVYEKLDSVLSPVMFFYVLICSISICCSVVQLSMDMPPAQKLWVVEYVMFQAFQLFLFCWHSNEVAVETDAISSGCSESKWWRSNIRQRKLLVLLMGKMDQRYILTAGPFTTLSVPTFIDIIKGSYSFYTLFMQMQDIHQD